MKEINIGNRIIGENRAVFIIAEAGVNHNGNLNTAKRMIEVASDFGADAIKFQHANAEKTAIKKSPLVKYQRKQENIDSQYKMIKKLQFSDEQRFELSDFAKDHNIIFFSKPSYEEAVDILLKMDIPLMKVGSGEITYLTLLEKIAQTHLPTIISTGMSTLGEIEEAVNIFRELNNNKLILLQCTSNYPTDYKNVNLRAMSTLRYSFDLPIGFSDHTMGITASVAAAALGACVIEKHFTLNRNLPGPDHKASLEPTEFKNLINQIRIVEQCLGTKIKKPLESEEEIRRLSRKSIVARVDIKKGEKITKKMLSYKRPGFGLPQSYMNIIANRHAKIDINKDEIITWEMI